MSLLELSSYETEEDNKWCDICIKKGEVKQEAVIYCTQCDKTFCTDHEKVITINTYFLL